MITSLTTIIILAQAQYVSLSRKILLEMSFEKTALNLSLQQQHPSLSNRDASSYRTVLFKEGSVNFYASSLDLAYASLDNDSSVLSSPMTINNAQVRAKSVVSKFCGPRTIGDVFINNALNNEGQITFRLVQLEGQYPHRNTALATVSTKTGDVTHFQYTNPPTVGSIPPLVLTQAQAQNRALAFSESYQIGTQLELLRARGPVWYPIKKLPADHPDLRNNMSPAETQWGDANGAFLVYEFRFKRVGVARQTWMCLVDAATGKAYYGAWEYEREPPL